MSRILHKAYGLSIDSDLPLPELSSLSPDTVDGVDIEIRQLTLEAPEHYGALRQMGPFLWASTTCLWLQVPGVVTFLVREGRQILFEPAVGVDEDSIRLFLLGSAIGALLMQRGLLVLHGNAVRIGDRCMVCLGHSGAGKSTLATAFSQRGYEILADDVVPVTADGWVLPGIARAKLWADSIKHLGIETTGLQRIRPMLEKFSLPLDRSPVLEPLALGGLYILDKHNLPDSTIEPLQGIQRFGWLCEHNYRPRFIDAMGLQAQRFSLCVAIAGKVKVKQIMRSSTVFDVDSLVDKILADMGVVA
ncbi:HPr serine kinase domain-containing protein [Ectopseudomonas mendocina]|uniref:HPr serine kinase domain-containing protein n=1 Tax=Ectopseudomonas mendocina TaxID=300 RepID=A0A379IZB8_ECTME|nr:hypothetical protein [Pseudomonas mendocina]SUD41153.1 HPr serine kinase domain-containing protein [Pseudomonas mendocina]